MGFAVYLLFAEVDLHCHLPPPSFSPSPDFMTQYTIHPFTRTGMLGGVEIFLQVTQADMFYSLQEELRVSSAVLRCKGKARTHGNCLPINGKVDSLCM